ncbi:MAG: pyruvate, phosphate dikinase [Bacillota bacterium]|jgi:pyruvate,orthophosphate dikinase|nr:pyruvate, phosphate dikinase [Bacillota bacterium]MDD3299046.1 pyruvate, phosphate dikinase [Bacillota bacterium]MDD3851786.1 pyruvate, phosphate dikinase [Bacillota bacterium]MDD4708022.1 pyruvate, phosphate dikinase [Bacillota bacterium]
MDKYVYMFEEGKAGMKDLLGGKGANLAEMTRIGLPVPPGFTVTTEACNKYYSGWENQLSPGLTEELFTCVRNLEKITDKTFGDIQNPLLVSVRSGAVISMPGMMDTILNLGLNDRSVTGLARSTGNERFAYDSYRRFIQMFGDVVCQIEKYKFEAILDLVKEKRGAEFDTDLTAEDLKEVAKRYKELYSREMKEEFPQDPNDQLLLAVGAVFRSWDNPRARAYRNINDIPHNLGTAVNVQSMVFGNLGDTSGTGVAFTRNPATGEKALFGEFLLNAQGEDVVAGIRTPKPIESMDEVFPDVHKQFRETAVLLEKHYRDMQDIEFTVERGKLYILQTRNGKRTAAAAVKVAVDLVNEGLITKEDALMRIPPGQLDQLLHPNFDVKELEKAQLLAQGLPASPGAATGAVYFTAEEAVKAAQAGTKVILVRQETSPEDIEGMNAAEGILTSRGGMTSHAAVVARGMGKCCVAGCGAIRVEENQKRFTVKGVTVSEGESISLDGSTGRVYSGSIPTTEPQLSGSFATLMEWADEIRELEVWTNADNPKDAATAVRFGAEGIGLCRTEHMFFEEDRIPAVREMILSRTTEQREKVLEKLLPMQKEDFKGIFKAMGEMPVTIRLLDPPLHEFLPREERDIKALAEDMDMSVGEINGLIKDMEEFNPMLGHRGCRLAITFPEIARMQTRAIIEAAIEVIKETGIRVNPEIMVPLIGNVSEFKYLKDLIVETADEIIRQSGTDLHYLTGTMIEVPRAAITADEVAKEAEFFSFGTNDLTQMTMGFSRDDAGKFLDEYKNKGIIDVDPFQRLDQIGVGKLVEMAVELGKKARPDIKLGICGEHGGEPSSIDFFHRVGLDYVSCSPFRVPIARLAAAQAAIVTRGRGC